VTRSKVKNISALHLFFSLNVVFILNFLKMAPVLVRFSPGFLSGGGFSAEHVKEG
jgi:hypothetical protein